MEAQLEPGLRDPSPNTEVSPTGGGPCPRWHSAGERPVPPVQGKGSAVCRRWRLRSAAPALAEAADAARARTRRGGH